MVLCGVLLCCVLLCGVLCFCDLLHSKMIEKIPFRRISLRSCSGVGVFFVLCVVRCCCALYVRKELYHFLVALACCVFCVVCCALLCVLTEVLSYVYHFVVYFCVVLCCVLCVVRYVFSVVLT